MLAHLDAQGPSKYDMPEYFLDLDQIPLTPSRTIRRRDAVETIARGRAVLELARAASSKAARG